MNWTIVVFISRTDTMKFYRAIKNFGLYASIINTPRALSSSCGISVKIDRRLINHSSTIINQLKLYSFKGIFLIEHIGKQEIIKRLL